MPELPEVEVVRRGLQAHIAGKTITTVAVHHPRAVRRHLPGAADLTARLLGATIESTDRRGKYLWLTLSDDTALVVHLGMSGQMLLGPITKTEHLRIAATLDDGTALSFVDQRTFGGWQLADLVTDAFEVRETYLTDHVRPDGDTQQYLWTAARRIA